MDLVFTRADQLFEIVSQHSPLWVYALVLISMIIENIVPPFPGDLIIFVCGVYAASGHVSWLLVYFLSIIGTLISVMALFYLGRIKGRHVFISGHARWLGVDKLAKVENWFSRWGEKLLLLSRWLSGVRALLALFAGVGGVRTSKMITYSLISTITWNFAVLYLALRIRQDWQQMNAIMGTYGLVIIIGICLVIIGVTANTIYQRNRSRVI